jgi:hypothetical protein
MEGGGGEVCIYMWVFITRKKKRGANLYILLINKVYFIYTKKKSPLLMLAGGENRIPTINA